jgi:tetratricopeptide (TPR) repeat protein
VDRLRSDHHEEAPGLEIAWHCFRGGRDREAIPYLLNGARDAIRRGAPDVAEHALSSALPGLKEPEATEARFLLAEVLQEQGQWLESLDMLAKLVERGNSGRADEQLVYTIMGKANLGASIAQEMLQHVPDLIAIVQNSQDTRVRARAARALAYLVIPMGDKTKIKSLIEVVDSIPEAGMDADSIGLLSLAKGLILFHAGLTSASLAEVNSGIERLKSLGAANVVMAQLHIGVGAINSRNGSYLEALAASEHAFRMATRLGNDSLTTLVIGNLVSYCGRLGRYEELSRWLARIPRARNQEFSGMVDLLISYFSALNEGVQGRRAQADEVMASLEQRMVGGIPRWMHQVWHFFRADVLWITGRHGEAIKTASEEINASSGELHSQAFAGLFSRWIAVTYLALGRPHEAISVLQNLLEKLDHYDALDQVEILCSICRVKVAAGSRDPGLEIALREGLSVLPPAVTSHLRRLEMLPWVG